MVFRETLNKLRDLGKWDELVTAAHGFLEDEPGSPFGLRALEQACGHLERGEDQADVWRRLVVEAGETHPFARKYAEYLDTLGRAEESVTYYQAALQAAITEKDWEGVEEIWMTLAQRAPEPLDFHLESAAALHEKGQTERAGILLQMLVPYYQSLGNPTLEIRLASQIGTYLPLDRGAREAVGKWYRDTYGDRPDYTDLLDRSGLLTFTPIPEAMERFNYYLKYGQGQVFYHTEWGAGRIARLDTIRMRIEIDFASKPNHSLTLELADKILKPLDSDDWRSIRAFEPDRGRAMVEEDPVALVVAALKSFGGKSTGRDLKERLTQFPIREADWARWWTNVNKLLKEDPHISVTGSGSKNYALRDEPLTYEDEVRARFLRVRGIRDRAEVAADYARHVRGAKTAAPPLLKDLMHETVSTRMGKEAPGEIVHAMFILDDIVKMFPDAAADVPIKASTYLADFQTAKKVLCSLEGAEHQNRWLRMMRDAYETEWPIFLEALFPDPEMPVRDALAEDLESRGRIDYIRQVFQECVAEPRNRYAIFTWFARRVLPDGEKAEAYGVQRSSLLRQCFPLLDYISAKSRTLDKNAAADMRKYAAAIRDVIKSDDFAVVKEVLGQEDKAFAGALHRSVGSTTGLETRQRDRILVLIEQRYPELLAPKHEGEQTASRVTYCLRDSLEKIRSELKHILEVELPRNARDIDTARQHGDLSENAEYKAAKEQQRLLQARASQLQQEIRTGHVPDISAIATERVGFGNRVRVRSLDDNETIEEYVILGPWESKPEQGIISYKSALGQGLQGKGVGESAEVTLPNAVKRYEIVEITNALAKVTSGE